MIDLKMWGPELWYVIHKVAYDCPNLPTEEQQKLYAKFYEDIPDMLPCLHCANHYRSYVMDNPILNFVKTKTLLFEWTVSLHNSVNKKQGKPELSLADALKVCIPNRYGVVITEVRN